MVRISRVLIAVAAAGLLVSACSVKKTERPPLTGPSELGLSLNVTANPDLLTQDGSSQSRIVILALDANGQPLRGVPLHLAMSVNGAAALFGLLSNTDVSTGSDGRAAVIYTAPPLPPDNTDKGTIVTINATPTGTDYANAVPRMVNIRLVPPAVVTPPPLASFTVSPSTAMPNAAVSFDASASHADAGVASYTWDFGDGTSGSGVNPTHSYGQQGSYTVTLIIMDTGGRTSYPSKQSVTVAMGDAPTANFVFSPGSPAPNQTIFLNASSSSAGDGRKITDYAWDFGNGASQRGVTTTVTYSASGTYTVTLVVTDDAGRTANKSQTITVSSSGSTAPVANFVFSPTAPSTGQSVLFNASGSTAGTGRTISGYSWDFGNGLPSGTGVTTSTTYAAAGTYNVTLTVTDSAGQTAVKSQTVTVIATGSGSPIANFVFSPTAPSAGQTVLFNASASTAGTGRTITSYSWDFGNGLAPGTGVTTSTTYAATGTYNVSLTITDSGGQTAVKSQQVTVTTSGSAGAPTASFVFSPSAPAVGEAVVFDASESTAAAGHTITSYAWAFGDTTNGTGRTYTKLAGYTPAATYTVVLTVTDDLGHTATTSQTITVGAPVTPVASFAVSPSPAAIGGTVVVDASTSTTSVGQTITTYEWNFGDSTTIFSTGNRTYDHAYAAAGTFTITLTVTDSAGRKAATTKTLEVK